MKWNGLYANFKPYESFCGNEIKNHKLQTAT